MDSNTADGNAANDPALIEDAMKRCRPEAVEAAKKYRENGDPKLAPVIVLGIVERFLEPEMREKLQNGGVELRFMEDLGVDSLTMVEIVMTVEQVLDVKIDNEELRELRTLGDVNSYITARLNGSSGAEPAVSGLDRELIAATLPHSDPFLFLDKAILEDGSARGTYLVKDDEFYLRGHFKNRPVVPASIMMEGLGQLAVLHLIKGDNGDTENTVDPGNIFFTACEAVRCSRLCKPGDELELSVVLKRLRHPLALYDGEISCGGERVATMKTITLAFDYQQNDGAAAHQNGSSAQ